MNFLFPSRVLVWFSCGTASATAAKLAVEKYGDRAELLYVRQAGIKLPVLTTMGYKNNNCIGCVKGGAGYWNKVRREFPDRFWKMARLERVLGFALLRIKGDPCYLDELPEDAGRYDEEPDIECGPHCSLELAEAL